ncbi:hypothetical protein [uncultured Algibacter sp.]|uniref:hypothetical protein n=1 Tax=uncultured Algibacter sp. TaxID=298659 RepID=UPI0026033A29|nr:hypothetical protein [uncultured Algibacter sp.]
MNLKPTQIKHAAFFVCVLVFFNCSKDDDNENNSSSCDESEISFLKKGNSWTYNIETLGTDNGEVSLTIKGCNGEGFSIDKEAKNSTFSEVLTGTDLWTETDEFILADAGINVDAKIYKKNSQLGDVWMHTQADGGVATHEVISIDSLVTVPAGTFSCVVYKYTATDIINESFVFWNDEIGQIKEDAGFFSLELAEYSTN